MSQRKEIRVLHVFGSLGLGGAETWLMALLKYFHEAHNQSRVKVRTDVCLTSGESSVFDEEATRLGATLHYLRYTRETLPRFVGQFRKLLKTGNYNAIHDHQDYTSGIHFLFGLGRLPPVRIAHVHNPLYQLNEHLADRASQYTKQIGRLLVTRLATSVAGTSAQLLREYGYEEDLNSGRAEAVYCGFDVSRFSGAWQTHRKALTAELGKPSDSRLILFVGRLGGSERATGGRSHKNPAFALEVAARCVSIDPRWNILFVGSGDSMVGVLQERARELGVSDHVFFLGQRHDIPHLMCAADVLLFPSSAEGLGMVTVEAQAAGLAVLASGTTPRECVVVPELVTFMDLHEPPQVWADALMDIAGRSRVSPSAANARVAASPFEIGNSTRKLLSLYTREGHVR